VEARTSEARRTPYPRSFENNPSTYSGESTLGTQLLQRPTHRDNGPTEHGRDASALRTHLKDLQRPSILTSHHPLSTSRAPSPYPLFPIFPFILSHTFSQNPTNPTIAGVSGISKGFVIVGF
jgi:hypothetical protein